jgi:hypothetical protein
VEIKEMKARVRISGINDPENAKKLSEMISKGRQKANEEGKAKAAFVKSAEKKEAFLAQGFGRA